MKKFGLLAGLFILPLASIQAQELNKTKFKKYQQLTQSRINEITNSSTSSNFKSKDETPLAQNRRIVKQEYFEDFNSPNPVEVTLYGYLTTTKGQGFHPSMTIGFPQELNYLGGSDKILLTNNPLNSWFMPEFSYPAIGISPDLVIDTLSLLDDAGLIHEFTVQRDASDKIVALSKTEDEGGGQLGYTKTDKFYTNNMLSKVEVYYGATLNNLQLESRRTITYNSNSNIATDTIAYYYQGNIDETVVFVYNYNANGSLNTVNVSSDDDYSVLAEVDYYSNGKFKSNKMSYFDANTFEYYTKDSVDYASNNFVNYRQLTEGDNDPSNSLAFILNYTYNSNLLDTVKISMKDGLDPEVLNAVAKYHYSIDDNPDSLALYDDIGTSQIGKFIFHYEPFNTTSFKNVSKNNNFNIYPNPVEDKMNIANKVDLKNPMATIQINDIKGASIWSTTQHLQKGDNAITLPSSLSAGMYIVSITADNSIFTQKIIKK